MTREGDELGPYSSKKEAEIEFSLYIKQMSDPYLTVEYNENHVEKTADDIWSQNFAH